MMMVIKSFIFFSLENVLRTLNRTKVWNISKIWQVDRGGMAYETLIAHKTLSLKPVVVPVAEKQFLACDELVLGNHSQTGVDGDRHVDFCYSNSPKELPT
jgi:hypothetical protein